MKKLTAIFLISFTILTLSCCKRDDDQPTPEFYAPHEFKDYFLFNAGTYWVYKNDKTGAIDSVYVTESYNDVVPVEVDGKKILFEELTVFVYSSYDGFTSKYYLTVPNPTGTQYYIPAIRHSKYKPGKFVAEELIFLQNMSSGLAINKFTQNSEGKVLSVNDTATIANIFYNNILKIYTENDAIEFGNDTEQWLSRGIGLLKNEIKDSNFSWNLIRYDIVK